MSATPLFSKIMTISIDASLLGCATDFSLAVDRDVIEIACLGSTGSKRAVPDLYGWTIGFSGLVTRTAEAGKKDFHQLLTTLTTSDASVAIALIPDASSLTYWRGAGYLTSVSMDGGVGSAVTFSGSITGDGPLTSLTTA